MKHFFLAITFLLFSTNVFGCSIIALPTSSKFDSEQYIFIGEVVELIESVKYDSYYESDRGNQGEALGLKIKVTENVYTPQSSTHFQVFPLRLTPSCSLMSDKEEVRQNYPIGSKVRVVAKKATIFKNQPAENSIIRLETSIFNRGSIARNDVSESLRTSANSVYEYRSFVDRQRTTAAEFVLFDSNYYLPIFELQKDLVRLEKAKPLNERNKILERLVFYPRVYDIDFPQIVWTYLKEKEKIVNLIKQWEQREKEFKSRKR